MSEQTWRNVLTDYRYLRATLSALVKPDRQLSATELIESALHDSMHSDTAMVILTQLDADHQAAARLDVAVKALTLWEKAFQAGYVRTGAAKGHVTIGKYTADEAHFWTREALEALKSESPASSTGINFPVVDDGCPCACHNGQKGIRHMMACHSPLLKAGDPSLPKFESSAEET